MSFSFSRCSYTQTTLLTPKMFYLIFRVTLFLSLPTLFLSLMTPEKSRVYCRKLPTHSHVCVKTGLFWFSFHEVKCQVNFYSAHLWNGHTKWKRDKMTNAIMTKTKRIDSYPIITHTHAMTLKMFYLKLQSIAQKKCSTPRKRKRHKMR